jgi:hypothetical protein
VNHGVAEPEPELPEALLFSRSRSRHVLPWASTIRPCKQMIENDKVELDGLEPHKNDVAT